MKVVVMMIGGMIVVVMMVVGEVEMTDLGMIVVVSEEKMTIVDGVVTTRGTPPQDEISLREK